MKRKFVLKIQIAAFFAFLKIWQIYADNSENAIDHPYEIEVDVMEIGSKREMTFNVTNKSYLNFIEEMKNDKDLSVKKIEKLSRKKRQFRPPAARLYDPDRKRNEDLGRMWWWHYSAAWHFQGNRYLNYYILRNKDKWHHVITESFKHIRQAETFHTKEGKEWSKDNKWAQHIVQRRIPRMYEWAKKSNDTGGFLCQVECFIGAIVVEWADKGPLYSWWCFSSESCKYKARFFMKGYTGSDQKTTTHKSIATCTHGFHNEKYGSKYIAAYGFEISKSKKKAFLHCDSKVKKVFADSELYTCEKETERICGYKSTVKGWQIVCCEYLQEHYYKKWNDVVDPRYPELLTCSGIPKWNYYKDNYGQIEDPKPNNNRKG